MEVSLQKIVNCVRCGYSLKGKRKNKLYCSLECYGFVRRKTNRCVDCQKIISLRKEVVRCFDCNKKWCVGENRGKTWKGGITPEQKKRRYLMKAMKWRKAIFERDDYTCQVCGQRGGKLNADHIKRWSEYPELRYELSNGRTLCENCHKKTDNYGNKGIMSNKKRNKLGQFIRL